MAEQEFKLRHSVSKADSINHCALLHIYRPVQKHVYIIKEAQMKDRNSFLSIVVHWKRKRKGINRRGKGHVSRTLKTQPRHWASVFDLMACI